MKVAIALLLLSTGCGSAHDEFSPREADEGEEAGVTPRSVGEEERDAASMITTTNAKMKNLQQILMTYRMHHGHLPDSLGELLQENERNFNDPYVEDRETIRDAWRNDFLYTKLSSRKYEIVALGADGVEGGEGPDADISSASP